VQRSALDVLLVLRLHLDDHFFVTLAAAHLDVEKRGLIEQVFGGAFR
jgi:hypothetical protein